MNSLDISGQFIFWWSVVSTLVGIILIGITVWQVVTAHYENKRKKDQVKIWQENANAISQGLKRIVAGVEDGYYTSIRDIEMSVHTLEAAAFGLWQSLYEERVVSEDEYKEEQQELRKRFKGKFEKTKVAQATSPQQTPESKKK
jgi:hypothetical protein